MPLSPPHGPQRDDLDWWTVNLHRSKDDLDKWSIADADTTTTSISKPARLFS
jgi:hypothetical protein